MVGGCVVGVRGVALRELWVTQAAAMARVTFNAVLASEWLYAGENSGKTTMTVWTTPDAVFKGITERSTMEVMREARFMQAINDRDHVMGPSHAPITLMHYGDFECPYSRVGARVMDVLQEQFEERLQIVFRHFPLTIKHPHAERAAEAAATQGKFWQMTELLFAYQHKLSDTYLTRYAMLLGMDAAKFEHDLVTHAHMERIRENVLSGKHSGVIGTPTFFINGQRYGGSNDLPSLKAAIQLTLETEGS